jgi:hypothetical protein
MPARTGRTKEIETKIFDQRHAEGFRIPDIGQFIPTAPQFIVGILQDIFGIGLVFD